MPTNQCNEIDCTNPVRSLGKCQGHYKRVQEGRNLSGPLRVVDPDRGCAYEACSKPHWGKGYCKYHYAVVLRGHGEEGYKTKPCAHCTVPFKPKAANALWCRVCCPTTQARARLQAFDVSQPEFEVMYSDLEGVCPLCQTREATCVDHCHKTGKVRGLLCKRCNSVLSEVETPGWLERAKAYLNEDPTLRCD
jgi:hypothetical protein